LAVVQPFRGFRYAQPAGADLSALIAPPYDVVGPAEQAQLLAAAAHNVIALELPEGSLDVQVPDNRYVTGQQRWRAWCRTGVLAADPVPAIYVLEQRYTHQGVARARRAFVAEVQLEPFAAGVILPHERTLPKAIDDRLQLTRATAANLSPVFGLYADPGQRLAPLLAQAMATAPLAVATGTDGVQATLWRLTDPGAHAVLAACLADQPLYIADGHHRYTTALAYRDECRAAAGPAAAGGVAPWDSVMMALVNMDDPGLVVWPTHRLARGGSGFAPATFWQRLAERFTLTPVAEAAPTAALAAASGPALLVRTRDGRTCLAVLRRDQDHGAAFPAGTSAAWRQLDVAVLQELVLWPLLQIHPDHPETLARLAFTHDDHAALAAAPEHDAVFVLRPVQVAQVAAVAQGGQTMPQKSTYFYPKLPSGLVFKSLA
jgi:uncharacterized protein (DUF1015 family)